ncbi:MAG TPA: hypothetical protein VGR26_08515 [Acidimicrobiales bacterium]|nr:hypothetical protein [Acidimicrobiales bacterium]
MEEKGGPLGLDRRLWWILGVVGVILVIAIVYLLADGDDGGGVVASLDTTTTTVVTATTTPSAVPSTARTRSAPQTTATAALTPMTVAPGRCTGTIAPDQPEPVAMVLYEAWTIADRGCAERVATDAVVDELFDASGAGASWDFQGCMAISEPEPYVDCAFTYEGGSAHMTLVFGEIEGWLVTDIGYVAD